MKNTKSFFQIVCSTCLEKLKIAEEVKASFLKTELALERLFGEERSEMLVEDTVEADQEQEEAGMASDNLKITSDLSDEEQDMSIASEIESESDLNLSTENEGISDTEDSDEEMGLQKNYNLPIKPKPNQKIRIRFRAKKPLKPKPFEYTCDTCSEKLYGESMLQRHLKMHRENNDEAKLSCKNCSKKFYLKHSLNKHLCVVKQVCYYCPGWPKFQTKKFLHEHMDNVHRTVDERDFYCTHPDCEYRSRQADGIIHHLMSHYENNVEICPYCQKAFTNHLHYKKHVNLKHKAPTGYMCDLDGTRLKYKTHLRKHMEAVHLKKKLHCEICFTPITTPYNLRQHLLAQHRKESSFKCSYCYLRFEKEESRRKHEQKHESWGGKRRKNE
jgi:hypothetical protein